MKDRFTNAYEYINNNMAREDGGDQDIAVTTSPWCNCKRT